jgi:hypothetical protein
LEDECFLYSPSNDNDGDPGVCVEKCPVGSEEEHDGMDYSTGKLLKNIIKTIFFLLY